MAKRCAYCGGKLSLLPVKKGRLRFCTKAHKKALEHREKEDDMRVIRVWQFLTWLHARDPPSKTDSSAISKPPTAFPSRR